LLPVRGLWQDRAMPRLVFAVVLLLAQAAPGLGLDPGDIVWAPQGGPVLRVAPEGGVPATLYEGAFVPRAGVVLDPSGDVLLVAQSDAPGLPAFSIVRVDPRSGAAEVVAGDGLLDGGTFDLAVGSSGEIFAGNIGSGLVRIDPVSGAQELISPFPAFGVGFSRAGALWVGDFGHTLVRLDPETGDELDRFTVLECGPDALFRLLAVEDDAVYVNCSASAIGGTGEAAILQVDTATGSASTVSSGGLLEDPYGIAVEASGDLLVADVGRVLRVDASGAQSVVAEAAVGAGGLAVRRAACRDGFDNDGDGLVDEADPECSGPDDDSEAPVDFDSLLGFIADAVESGGLVGLGPGHSAGGRLRAFRNMVQAAATLFEIGLPRVACKPLAAASARVDGRSRPPDFVTGAAAGEVATRVDALLESLACDGPPRPPRPPPSSEGRPHEDDLGDGNVFVGSPTPGAAGRPGMTRHDEGPRPARPRRAAHSRPTAER
jgi:streptogramin lyase